MDFADFEFQVIVVALSGHACGSELFTGFIHFIVRICVMPNYVSNVLPLLENDYCFSFGAVSDKKYLVIGVADRLM